MARLRHIAVCVKDLEKAAKFYENVFELKQVGREDIEIGSAIYMSDGVINLALLNFASTKGNDLKDPKNAVGANHFGFQVEDLAETQRRIEAAGGTVFFGLGGERKGNFERQFKGPDGAGFDISPHGRVGPDGRQSPSYTTFLIATNLSIVMAGRVPAIRVLRHDGKMWMPSEVGCSRLPHV